MELLPLKPELCFQMIKEVFSSMTGVKCRLGETQSVEIDKTAHDLTVIMGILGESNLSLFVGMNSDTVYSVSSAILHKEGGIVIGELGEAELPDIMQGTIEELTNRMSSSIANHLAGATKKACEVTPPVCAFGAGTDPGGALAGYYTDIESDLGPVCLFIACDKEATA
ncbi:MAG: hypothetical protein JXR97_13590 [Planctomycetes bacterium]|nr:hypothetical protein [Planctomycetota bacterium]